MLPPSPPPTRPPWPARPLLPTLLQRARVTVSAVAVDTSKLSPEQRAFLERKRSESRGPSASPVRQQRRRLLGGWGGVSSCTPSLPGMGMSWQAGSRRV